MQEAVDGASKQKIRENNDELCAAIYCRNSFHVLYYRLEK
jgi:hypothetical protein